MEVLAGVVGDCRSGKNFGSRSSGTSIGLFIDLQSFSCNSTPLCFHSSGAIAVPESLLVVDPVAPLPIVSQLTRGWFSRAFYFRWSDVVVKDRIIDSNGGQDCTD
jgi:hypothetical protein